MLLSVIFFFSIFAFLNSQPTKSRSQIFDQLMTGLSSCRSLDQLHNGTDNYSVRMTLATSLIDRMPKIDRGFFSLGLIVIEDIDPDCYYYRYVALRQANPRIVYEKGSNRTCFTEANDVLSLIKNKKSANCLFDIILNAGDNVSENATAELGVIDKVNDKQTDSNTVTIDDKGNTDYFSWEVNYR